MKKIFVFVAIILEIFLFNSQNIYSVIAKLPGQWSIYVGGNAMTNFGVSNSMLGTMKSVEDDYKKYSDYTQFPFKDSKTGSFRSTFLLSYRFPENRISVFISLQNALFSVDNDLRTLFGNQLNEEWANLYISSFMPGIEYSIGNEDDLLNAFGKFGIGFNIISGEVRYHNDYADIVPEFRLGFMTEIGGRLNIPSTPLAIEISTSYTNANLIGKARNQHFTYLSEINLNDGEHPSNSAIPAKTIDFLSINFGVRLWF